MREAAQFEQMYEELGFFAPQLGQILDATLHSLSECSYQVYYYNNHAPKRLGTLEQGYI